MSLLLKEYCNFVPVKDKAADIPLNEAAFNDLTEPVAGTLMVEVEGIHSHPFHTRNYTRYMPEALKDSVPRWTNPYLKPLIKYHNDQDGKIIGRVYHAEYTDHTSVEGAGGLIFTIAVPDQEADKDVQNRLLETVSIGVSASDVRCSVCGAHITDANEGCPNGHTRGAMYEGQHCFWDIYAIDPKEISYVIVPSDPYAKNIRTYRIGDEGIQLAAGYDGTGNNIPLQEKTGGNDPTEMDLKKQLEEAQAKIAELEKALEEAKAAPEPSDDVEALKAENEKLQKAVEAIQAELDKAKETGAADKQAIEDAAKAKEESEVKLAAAMEDMGVLRQEKEAAEAAGVTAQETFRAFVTDVLNDYRKIVGKAELKEEELKDRSMDSLQDTIKDLKEEIVALKKIDFQEGQVPNPTLPPKDNKPGKTEHDYRKVNLSEGLQELFQKLC